MKCGGKDCNREMRFVGSHLEPPENHFYVCYVCNRYWYPFGYDPESEED